MCKVYLDYNVYDSLAKKELEIKKHNSHEILYSVSHVEEYYKAECNCNKNNKKKLEELKCYIEHNSKQVILKQGLNDSIIEDNETSFDKCYKIVKQCDTRDQIINNGSSLYNINNEYSSKLKVNDKNYINLSNLNEIEIWKDQKIIQCISGFADYYASYPNNIFNTLLNSGKYSDDECLIILNYLNNKLPSTFILKKDCFKNKFNSFSLIELVIEFLNNRVLCRCGYNSDKNNKTTISGIHDVSHIIYATYCDFFVTNDKKLKKRAKAIYEYLGIHTKVIDMDEYNKLEA